MPRPSCWRRGAFNVPRVPGFAAAVPSSVATLTPMEYRNPDAARRRRRAGRRRVGDRRADRARDPRARAGPVTLAVGEHVRGPRVYRGRDIHWWMEAAGVLDERYDEVDDIVRARRVPSMQLAGSPDRGTFDLNALTDIGVKLVGRARRHPRRAARSSRARCATSASSPTSSSAGCSTRSTSGRRPSASTTRCRRRTDSRRRSCPTRRASASISPRGEIRTIIWATGFRPDYSWLDVDVLDAKGMVRHDGGVVVESPGMYLIGMPFLRRRKSSFIDGACDDAQDLAATWRRSSTVGPSRSG